MPNPTAKIVSRPRLLFRPDPVLGWSLSPNHAVKVGFRNGVMQHIDGQGWRAFDRPQNPSGPKVAVYGCSFTYGTGLADDETFTARLQQDMPDVQVLNRGIGGHGTVQNLLQFRRDIAANAVDAAIFAIISDHRFRNIAHPQRMRQYLNAEWYRLGVEHVPVARTDGDGTLRILYHSLWQPVIRDADFGIFLPDEFMVTAATLKVLEAVGETAHKARVPLRFAILDALDPAFTSAVIGRFPETQDISTPFDADHIFLPHDIHPNVAANKLFAQRLRPMIETLCRAIPGKGA